MTNAETIEAFYATPEPLHSTRRNNIRMNTQSLLLRSLAECPFPDDLNAAIDFTTKPIIDAQRSSTNQASITDAQRKDFEHLTDLAIADAVAAIQNAAESPNITVPDICLKAATKLELPIT